MSKHEAMQTCQYKYWRRNLISSAIIFVVCMAVFVVGLITYGDFKSLVCTIVFPIAFLPFVIYYCVRMIGLCVHARDYSKASVTIDSAEFIGQYGDGWYSCDAHYDATTVVHFRVYLRYFPGGVDLRAAKLVEVWYNEKNGKALFANKE